MLAVPNTPSGSLIIAIGIVCWTIAGNAAKADEPLPSPAEPEIVARPPATTMHTVTGVASCAAASCHGGPMAGNYSVSSFAYSLWAAEDKHAKAYDVLFNDRSKRMSKEPHRDARCLSCHSMQSAHKHTLSVAMLSDGVGCESCHGNASRWRAIHFLPEWDTYTKDQKQDSLGFRDLSDPLGRATQCVDCHIGSEGREVDHDLIAAGHPRLMFEFAAYQRMQPIHWNTRGKAESQPDFSARSWAVGQAVSQAAALRQLARRAEKPKEWPEFAEFDCYACHQTLRSNLTLRAEPQRLGVPAWGDWYTAFAGFEDFSELKSKVAAAWPVADDAQLRELAALANRAAELCDSRASALNSSKKWNSSALAKRLTESEGDSRSWESAAQCYLAVVALRASQSRQNSALVDLETSLRKMLAFSPGTDSPDNFSPVEYERMLRKLQEWLSHE